MSEQAWLDALKAAKYSGALRVRQGDKDVTYRSIEEIDRAIASLERAMGLRKTTHVNVYSSKGLA